LEYFPLFFDLKKKPCLIIGGGEIAVRKARLISRAGAIINVCSETVCDELQTLVDSSGGATWLRKYDTDILSTVKLSLIHISEPTRPY